MTYVRRPLIAVLGLFAGAIVLDRLGAGADRQTITVSAYVIALAAISAPLFSTSIRRMSRTGFVIAAIGIHATWSLILGSAPRAGSDVYVAAIEVVFIGLTSALGAQTGRALAAIDDVITATAAGESPAIDLEGPTAASEIETEIARSRRHDRPMSVTVLSPTTEGLESALDQAGLELDRAVRTRFLFGSLARNVARQLRRSDLLFEHRPSGRLIVLSPETDDSGTDLLIRRVVNAAARAGIELRAGSAAFPDDGIGFEALVDRAQQELDAEGGSQLRAVREGRSA